MTISELQQAAYDNAKAKGFHEGDVDIDQKLLLAVGELVEAQNELRDGHLPTSVYSNDPVSTNWCGTFDEPRKPEGFGIELADAVIRIADLAALTDVDLQHCVLLKMKYNATRPFKHGGKAF